MYHIESQEMSDAFFACWQAALRHLNHQVDGGIPSWLRAIPEPPFLEHLSFRLGNQLFYIRVEDVDRRIEGPGSLEGVLWVAEETNGHACLLSMQRTLDGRWAPVHAGWGLIDAHTRSAVHPAALVTDARIDMTPWERHDLAVQIVRDHLIDTGREVIAWHGNPTVDPAIWFIGASQTPEWVVVRVATVPDPPPSRPDDWEAIMCACAHISRVGHFAPLRLCHPQQPMDAADAAALPLWRGHGVAALFTGLESHDPDAALRPRASLTTPSGARSNRERRGGHQGSVTTDTSDDCS